MMMTAAIGTSALSTGLVQWCANPYITRIFVHETDASTNMNSKLTIESLTFFGNPIQTQLTVDNLMVSDRMFTNWKIKPEAKIVKVSGTASDTKSTGDGCRSYLVNKSSTLFRHRTHFYVHPGLFDTTSSSSTSTSAVSADAPPTPSTTSNKSKLTIQSVISDSDKMLLSRIHKSIIHGGTRSNHPLTKDKEANQQLLQYVQEQETWDEKLKRIRNSKKPD